MDIILIPGLWLHGSSWEKVVAVLEQAGHRTHPITLPGMESRDADRSGITLRDHVAAVVAAIDAVDPADGEVALVGHSAGAAIAHAAIDARPERVSRAVYVGGFPTGAGDVVAGGYPVEDGEIPLPDWSAFADEDLAELNDEALAEFRERAIPSPECVARDAQRLGDDRRYDVPVTVVATEFTGEMLRGWIEQGEQPVRELAQIRDVEYVDLPTGHWPQFTRPEELGRAILSAVEGTPSGEAGTNLDEHGRPEPPLVGDETATLLGFLDYQRATLDWKSRGLDAAGAQATVGVSTITLGGLLKHIAKVEDYWFSERLRGNAMDSRWRVRGWETDPDWDWHPTAEESYEQLHALWQEAVVHSRKMVDEALAEGGLDVSAQEPWPNGESPSLRWILVHMIEEYARHNGHADLIRESVDGLTGE